MNTEFNKTQFVSEFIDSQVLKTLSNYIEIPCVSMAYKNNWQEDMHKACELIYVWLKDFLPKEAKVIVQENTQLHTPTILCHIPKKASSKQQQGKPQSEGSVLLYGHFDKQPEMTGWKEGFSAFKAVLEDNKLYGRGGADDGYSAFSAVTAILAADSHPDILLILESSEESGSIDLQNHLELIQKSELKDVFNNIEVVICLDSGALTFDRLWTTTSLRGNLSCTIKAEVSSEGVHSGQAGGIVPSSWFILNEILGRFIDLKTQKVKLSAPVISKQTTDQIKINAQILGEAIKSENSVLNQVHLLESNNVSLLQNNNYGYSVEVVGFNGAPKPDVAGNVHQPFAEVKLSFRLPPSSNGEELVTLLKKSVVDAPYNAVVKLNFESEIAQGWQLIEPQNQLNDKLNEAWNSSSIELFNKPAGQLGEGGTIPFINMLQIKFPKAVFLITGVLGPNTNAHGPNEFLDIDYMKKLTVAIANVLESF